MRLLRGSDRLGCTQFEVLEGGGKWRDKEMATNREWDRPSSDQVGQDIVRPRDVNTRVVVEKNTHCPAQNLANGSFSNAWRY